MGDHFRRRGWTRSAALFSVSYQSLGQRSRLLGLSRLEFSVIVALVAGLAAVLLYRIPALQAESERLQVELTTRHIRLGIQNAVAQHIMRNQEDRIIEIVMSNPMDFLEHETEGLKRTTPDRKVVGAWAYDQMTRKLIYWPRFRETFGDADALQWSYVAVIDSSGRAVGAHLVSVN